MHVLTFNLPSATKREISSLTSYQIGWNIASPSYFTRSTARISSSLRVIPKTQTSSPGCVPTSRHLRWSKMLWYRSSLRNWLVSISSRQVKSYTCRSGIATSLTLSAPKVTHLVYLTSYFVDVPLKCKTQIRKKLRSSVVNNDAYSTQALPSIIHPMTQVTIVHLPKKIFRWYSQRLNVSSL